MINRYSYPEMTSIWSNKTKFRICLDIEIHVCDALANLGIIPKESAKNIREKGSLATIDIDKIRDIESITKHDFIAFLTYISEIIGSDSRFIHQGLTSSDILDTAFNIQLMKASDIIFNDLDKLLLILKKKAYEYKNTITIGRSHGIHAEPTTFGIKLAVAYSEFSRCRKRLEYAYKEISTCSISGAVGTFANIDPRVEKYVAKIFNMTPEPISTQIIPRDRHAVFFTTLGIIASCIERISVEIRHLQRTELLEVEENFSIGQKGSSAMPHKRNPIMSENLTGLSRIIRSYAIPAMENIVLWHERDISHSSVERFIGPDATITLDFALKRITEIIENLIVYPENMLKNLNRYYGLIYSQRVLLALISHGMNRDEAYQIVQKNAIKVLEVKENFLSILLSDKKIRNFLSEDTIQSIFTLNYYTKHVDTIFRNVFEN